MLFFKKKNSIEDAIANSVKEQGEVPSAEVKKDSNVDTGNAKLDIQLTKIQAQIDSFSEIRKANSEMFSRLQEQIGEVRGMILDLSKQTGTIEVKATKAADLVETVQPEKLMVEVRKTEGKVEALKANIESNETMMQDIMKSLKEMRQQMNFYKGIDQVVKLNEDVKKELIDIKRVETIVMRHSDKIDTIFVDFNKKYTEFAKFDELVNSLDKSSKAIMTDFDKLKVTLSSKADKGEFVKLLDKFNDFEKHTNNILNLLDERSKHTKKDLLDSFDNIKQAVAKKYQISMENIESPKEEKQADPAKKDEKKKSFFDFSKKDDKKTDAKDAKTPAEDKKIIDKEIKEEPKLKEETASKEEPKAA